MTQVDVSAHLGGAPPASPRPRTAVLVIHGIGEQVQYETIARAAEGIGRLEQETPKVRVRSVQTPEGEMRRAEVDLADVDVHVYEAYWAPLTKGRVTLRDVIAFLARGAASGIRNARSGTRRFVFGAIEEAERDLTTLLALVVASIVLAALVVVDAVALAVAAAHLGVPTGLSQRTLDEGAWGIVIVGLSLLLLGVWTSIARSVRAARRRDQSTTLLVGASVGVALLVLVVGRDLIPAWVRVAIVAFLLFLNAIFFAPERADKAVSGVVGVVTTMTWAAFALTLAALVGLAVVLGIFLATGGDAPWTPASPPPIALVAFAWAALIVATYLGRSLLVDYVGDVAAYVSQKKLDKFHDLRKEIKDLARRAAIGVYAQGYQRVAIVGHSLGSVVAYDTLNALLREDALDAPKGRDVAGRTRLLLTFGSPLDKTAFLFATSKKGLSPTREALATLSQPLLLDPKLRERIPWINVYSRADPVSGELNLYGAPITNETDAEASTPLLAHNEYWGNALVWTRVREHLVRSGEPSRTVPVKEKAPVLTPRRRPRA